ncbi:MAG: heme-binding domain-containing protein [Chloroflexi bacterium]|nr:heme-binding domain-containing protein [Chloroflexota bacterium]
MNRSARLGGLGFLGLVALFVLIQLIPYGHDYTNPPVVKEPAWDSPATRDLAVRACYDCHSNETRWPWYTDIAPVSWLIQHDVDEGRGRLNFSEWNLRQRSARDMAETVQRGSMPRWFYVPIHPDANLTAAEKDQLIRGLQAISNTSGQ